MLAQHEFNKVVNVKAPVVDTALVVDTFLEKSK